ncbi:MAG: Lsr2 family DNA-binding protein [Micromonosporaceae bacterium]
MPYLLRLPLDDGMVFRTSGTWPRTNALYCYPVPAEEWPADPDIVEQVLMHLAGRRDRSHRNDRTPRRTERPEPTTAEVRAWARANGIPVPDRGRLHPRDMASLAHRQPVETRRVVGAFRQATF